MRILFVLNLLCCMSSSASAATLPACQPSRACALERAQRLVLQELTQPIDSRRSEPSAQQDAVQLLGLLMARDPREYRSGFTRTVLERIVASGQQELLDDLARTLVDRQADAAALAALVDIEDIAGRTSLYQRMALGHATARRFELAYWAASRMQAGKDRERVVLSIADAELIAGEALRASQTAGTLLEPGREQPELREDVLRIQAQAAAQLGEPRRALELARQIEQPETLKAALRSVIDVQLERKDRSDALTTVRFLRDQLRRRNALKPAQFEIAESLSLLGESREALQLVQGSPAEQALLLAAIASGAARDQRFDEALATLEKIPKEQRPLVRNSAAFVAQQRALSGVDVPTAFDAAHAFSPLSADERSRWVRSTAVLLVRAENLPRARDALSYEVEIVLQEPACDAGSGCVPTPARRDLEDRCDVGGRDGSLCNIAVLQARFGFIEDADRTSIQLRSEHASITVQLAVAAAQVAAGRTVLARRTYTRTLQLARLEPNLKFFEPALAAYADWIASDPQHHDALPDLYAASRELRRIDANAGCRGEGALMAVVTAHASAGKFATAFDMAQTQLQCKQLRAYLNIYARGKR